MRIPAAVASLHREWAQASDLGWRGMDTVFQHLNEQPETVEDEVETGKTPYQDLYIYILNGLVTDEDEQDLGNDFMGNWVEDNSSFLFFGRPADEAVGRILKLYPEVELMESHHFTYAQWQGGGLRPFKVGDFVVIPPWKKQKAIEAGIEILLDPGVVFGNGLHPTTRDCLKAISLAKQQNPFRRVLDLGTGTGVLALAVALLGAESVLAIDINPLCVKTAKNNVGLNGLKGVVRVAQGPAEDFIKEPADLVIANIHHEVIKSLLNLDGFYDMERLIISGLLRSQFRDVKEKLQEARFEIIQEWDHNMTWFTVYAKKELEMKKGGFYGS